MSLLEEIKNGRHSNSTARNSMGCSENWYDAHYAIANTFTDDELDSMTPYQLECLVRLAENMADAFY